MRHLVLTLLLAGSIALEQQQSPAACPVTREAVLSVQQAAHDAVVRGDFAAMARVEVSNKIFDDGPIEDVLVKFDDGIAILNFVDRGRTVDQSVNVTMFGSSRETFIFGCRDREWKIIFRSEIQIPNATRSSDPSTLAKLDDFVGHYRFSQDGEKGEIEVFRKGEKLFERWGTSDADEIRPGRYDTFFTPYDGMVERFIRDSKGPE